MAVDTLIAAKTYVIDRSDQDKTYMVEMNDFNKVANSVHATKTPYPNRFEFTVDDTSNSQGTYCLSFIPNSSNKSVGQIKVYNKLPNQLVNRVVAHVVVRALNERYKVRQGIYSIVAAEA